MYTPNADTSQSTMFFASEWIQDLVTYSVNFALYWVWLYFKTALHFAEHDTGNWIWYLTRCENKQRIISSLSPMRLGV